MKTHIIKLPQVLYRELVNALKRKEAVTIYDIGTIYASQYRKKAHPSLVSNGNVKKYSHKPTKLTRINFRPSAELKEAL